MSFKIGDKVKTALGVRIGEVVGFGVPITDPPILSDKWVHVLWPEGINVESGPAIKEILYFEKLQKVTPEDVTNMEANAKEIMNMNRN